MLLGDSTAKHERRYQVDQVTLNANPSIVSASEYIAGVEVVNASALKHSQASGGAAHDPIYSTSNVNTPESRQNLKPLQLKLNHMKDEEAEPAGRMTLRSLHISSTEDMKDGDIAFHQSGLTTGKAVEDSPEIIRKK